MMVSDHLPRSMPEQRGAVRNVPAMMLAAQAAIRTE